MWKKNDSLEFFSGALIKPFTEPDLFKVLIGRYYIFHLSNVDEQSSDNLYLNGSAQLVSTNSDGVTDGYVSNEVVISGKAFIFYDALYDETYYPELGVGMGKVLLQNKNYYYKDHGVKRQPSTNSVRDYIIASCYGFSLQNGILSKDYIPHPLSVQAGIKSGQFIL